MKKPGSMRRNKPINALPANEFRSDAAVMGKKGFEGISDLYR